MPKRSYIELPGGDVSVNPRYYGGAAGALNQRRKGVFANYPAMSPKYHTGNTDASLEHMARLFVPFGSKTTRDNYLRTFTGRAKNLARTLAVYNQNSNEYRYGTGYIDFLLERADERQHEKHQVVEVLSDNYVSYFFGQKAPIFNYSGTLINSRQDDWRTSFAIIYNDILRGTQLARRRVTVTLAYDDVMVTGAMLATQQTLRAEMELGVGFHFQILVKRFDIGVRYDSSLREPTLTSSYPYKMSPNVFAVQAVNETNAVVHTANAPILTDSTRQRKKPTDQVNVYVTSPEVNPDQEYNAGTFSNNADVKPIEPNVPRTTLD